MDKFTLQLTDQAARHALDTAFYYVSMGETMPVAKQRALEELERRFHAIRMGLHGQRSGLRLHLDQLPKKMERAFYRVLRAERERLDLVALWDKLKAELQPCFEATLF